MKKFLIIALIVLVGLGIVIAGVFLRKDQAADPQGQGILPQGDTLPIGGFAGGGQGDLPGLPGDDGNGAGSENLAASINLISQASVLDYVFNTEEGLLIFESNGSVTAIADEKIIADANFEDILGGWFSKNGEWLLVKSQNSQNPRWSLLNVSSRTWKDMAVNTREIVWSPEDSRLAYFAKRTDGTSLTTFNPESETTNSIMAFAAPDLRIKWAAENLMFVMDRPTSLIESNVWRLSPNTGEFRVFRSRVRGPDILWDENDRGILFLAGPTGGVLDFVDSAGSASKTANFLTLPSKCVFGSSTEDSEENSILDSYLFCAIPRNIADLRNSQLPDDYLKNKFSTSDIMLAIDLENDAFLSLVKTSSDFVFDAVNLKIYNRELYFTDKNLRGLYRIPLTAITSIEEYSDIEELSESQDSGS